MSNLTQSLAGGDPEVEPMEAMTISFLKLPTLVLIVFSKFFLNLFCSLFQITKVYF